MVINVDDVYCDADDVYYYFPMIMLMMVMVMVLITMVIRR